MLKLFTIPKPFRGHIGLIQRNAIQSWLRLQPACEVILFGDDEGTAEIAAEFDVRHVPDIACNEYGTPLVNDIFEKAQRLASHELLCYVNADIILMSDFIMAVNEVARRKQRFLIVGRRWDLDMTQVLDFGPNWVERLRACVAQKGQLHSRWGIDYFVFPQGLWGEIPAFAIGRTAWDNWLLYRARARRAAVIDATQVVMAVHQNHGYAHNSQGKEGIWRGPEAKRNLALAGDWAHIFNLSDATHVLSPTGLKWPVDREQIGQYLRTLPVLYPYLHLPVQLFVKTINLSHPIRTRLGLTLPAGGSRE